MGAGQGRLHWLPLRDTVIFVTSQTRPRKRWNFPSPKSKKNLGGKLQGFSSSRTASPQGDSVFLNPITRQERVSMVWDRIVH